MTKSTIIDLLTKKYFFFINYIDDLTVEEYLFSNEKKWTAGQQLEHIVLCIKPIVQVFSLDKLSIEQNFGKSVKPSSTYDVILNNYTDKLNEGGKAPDRYLPESNLSNQRSVLSETLNKMIQDLCFKIEKFSEQDLDDLVIPHPLLGKLTMREMLYNAIYHVEHHHELTKQNLKN